MREYGEGRTVMVSAPMSPAEVEALWGLAHRLGMSRAETIRHLVRKAIDAQQRTRQDNLAALDVIIDGMTASEPEAWDSYTPDGEGGYDRKVHTYFEESDDVREAMEQEVQG